MDDITGSKEWLCSACCSVRLSRRENTLGLKRVKPDRSVGRKPSLPPTPTKAEH